MVLSRKRSIMRAVSSVRLVTYVDSPSSMFQCKGQFVEMDARLSAMESTFKEGYDEMQALNSTIGTVSLKIQDKADQDKVCLSQMPCSGCVCL